MRKAPLAFSFLLAIPVACVLAMAGCGGQSMGSINTGGNNASAGMVPVGMVVTDTPPTGVSVLFFQLGISSATLTPGNLPLLSVTNPVPVNVSQLQTEVDFLGNANVAPGTYTGLSMTLANPQLTIFNGSGASIGTCANNSVCQLTPTPTSQSLTFSAAPFPVTLSAESPLAFKLDIHLDTIIQPDMTVNLAATGGVTLEELPIPPKGEPVPEIGRLVGTVETVGASQFTLLGLDGRTFTIDTDSSTTYHYPGSVCSAEAFSCLAKTQVVKVLVSLQPDGNLLAAAVDFVQTAIQPTVEGTVVNLNTSGGNTTMNLILQMEPMASTELVLPLGRFVSVTVPSTGVTYSVDSGGFAVPSGLTFMAASDLQVGQQVMVTIVGPISVNGALGLPGTPVPPPTIAFATDSVELEPSQITGQVGATNSTALNFALKTFPAVFLPPAANTTSAPILAPIQIMIDTTAATGFVNFPTDNFSSLAPGQVVSVHGWLFGTPDGATSTTIAADRVLLRPGPTPAF